MYSSTITEYEDNKDKKSEQPKTENDTDSILHQLPQEDESGKQTLIWRNIIGLVVLHALALYLLLVYSPKATLWTWIWFLTTGHISGIGITAGLHRLWTHRSYSAKLPLKILLLALYCSAGHLTPTKWIRIHRTHHKFTDTAADPHNANRGFWYSHMGWLAMKVHPTARAYSKTVDMSDIAADPTIRFVDKYFPALVVTTCFILPGLIPVYVWNEKWPVTLAGVVVRYVWLLNASCSVNSFAHIWGNRPYNRNIKPTENWVVSIFALGEGWHNYHHCFPWDYKASELSRFNPSTRFINFMAWLGWAYDLKTPSEEIVDRFCANKGDGTPCPSKTKQS